MKNPGVDERNRMDSLQDKQAAVNAYEVLKKKSLVYDQIVAGRVSGSSNRFLVDFEQKGWEDRDRRGDEQDQGREVPLWEQLADPGGEMGSCPWTPHHPTTTFFLTPLTTLSLTIHCTLSCRRPQRLRRDGRRARPLGDAGL
jgi:hypothetical protein